VAGYDPDVFGEIAYCLPEHDPGDLGGYRSFSKRGGNWFWPPNNQGL